MRRERLQSIDLLRGLVMVVMAIDHVRDMLGSAHFDPLDPARATPLLYATRLVTHLCAPGFVVLAGASAYLSHKPPRELSRFLLSRGLWLVVVELTIMKVGWTFNLDYRTIGLQVIWVIGWSMVALAGLIFLPRPALAALAVAVIALHNLFDGVQVAALSSPQATARDVVVTFLHVHSSPVIYPFVPWFAVMALGYVLGPIFEDETRRRRRTLVLLGLGCCAAFVAVRGLNAYGDPHPWTAGHPVLTFFRVEKYPPSLAYLLMTLGPIFLLLAAAERVRAPALVVVGRVPFFFYVAHIYLIHALAVLLGVATGFGARALMVSWPRFPPAFGLPLAGVYLAWALVVLALYPACRWFARVKAARRDWWLSYL